MKFLIIFAAFLLKVLIPDWISTLAEESRIINGMAAINGQFPYQVLLDIRLEEGVNRCGGSLIGNEWVLTAAHCLIGVQYIDARFGSIDSKDPEYSHRIYPDSIIIHPDFVLRKYVDDIALIRIPMITLTNTVNIVRLPPLASAYPTYEDEYAIASGWGAIQDFPFQFSQYLQWVRMEVISNSLCALYFPNGVISWSIICTGTFGGMSTCVGDSGGPLVLDFSGELIGITAFGTFSCSNGAPAAFTRVTTFLEWIKENTGIAY